MADELYVFAETDLNDREEYHGGFKPGKVLEWQTIQRGCSDRLGQIQNLQFGAVLTDTDYFFRGLLDDPDRKYLTNRPFTIEIIDDEDRRLEVEPMIIANGFVGEYSPKENLQFEIKGHDWLKRKTTRRAKSNENWQRRITLEDFPKAKGTITTTSGVVEYSNVGKIIPIIYGRITDTNYQDPGPIGFNNPDIFSDYGDGQFKPIYVGDYVLNGVTWRGALIAQHSVEIESGYVLNNPVDLLHDPDWLTPVKPADWGAAGFDITSARQCFVPINGRDYSMIFVKGYAGDLFCGKEKVPQDLTGSEPLTINVFGRTANNSSGVIDGVLLTDGFDQYQDFLANFVCPDEQWTGGPQLEFPVFPTIPNLQIVDTTSFERCKQMAIERVGGGYELNFVLGANNKSESLLDVIAQFNLNLDCQHYWNRRGQFAITMEPEDESDVILDPINDVVDINKDSLKIIDKVSQDFFNILPFRHTLDYVGRMQRDLNTEWRSEMRGDVERRHTSSIENYELEREASTYEFRFIRGRNRMEDSLFYDQGTATVEDVMMRIAARYADPQRIVTLTGVYNLLPYECGDVFALSSIEGIGVNGWNGRVLRVLNHAVNPSSGQVTLTCYDLRSVVDAREELTNASGGSPAGSPVYSPPTVGIPGSPVDEDDVLVAMPAGAITFTGGAPSLAVFDGNVFLAMPSGSATLSGQVPVSVVAGDIPIAVPVGALALAGLAPTRLNSGVTLPSSGRTLYLDASDTDRLWKEAAMSTHPADGEAVMAWDDESDATNFAMISATTGPRYEADGFNGRGCLDFDGSASVLRSRTDANASAAISNFITNTTFVMFVSFIMEGDAPSNAQPSQNDMIVGDDFGYCGLYVSTIAGVHTLSVGNSDGTPDSASVVISKNTKYVACIKHVGGVISIDVNNGALTASGSSGNTTSVANALVIGRNTSQYFNGKVGEIAIYNTDVTGSDLADAWDYFMGRWVSPAGDADVSITVPAGAITFTGRAPVLTLIDVPVGSATLTGRAPFIEILPSGLSLPSTNRTWHLNASTPIRLWKEVAMSSTPADGEMVVAWDDVNDATNFALIGSNGPAYSATGFNGRGCVDFDGTNDQLNARLDDNSNIAAINNFITNSNAVIFIAFIMEGDAASSPTYYNNDALILDSGSLIGLVIHSSAGVHTLRALNNDGAIDYAAVTISKNTKYVVCLKHVGGNISIDVNNGALTASTASGNTSALSGQWQVGRGALNYFDGKIGEIAIYNADVTGTDLSDAWNYFMNKWVL